MILVLTFDKKMPLVDNHFAFGLVIAKKVEHILSAEPLGLGGRSEAPTIFGRYLKKIIESNSN